jgi:hypothetical protein
MVEPQFNLGGWADVRPGMRSYPRPMPRSVVGRTFPESPWIAAGTDGAVLCLALVDRNADECVFANQDR